MFETLHLKCSRGIVDPRLVRKAGFILGVEDKNVQGNSIDLTVGEIFTVEGELHLDNTGNRLLPNFVPVPTLEEEYPTYCLVPDTVYQVEFQETVCLPYYLCGITLVRSTLAKSGTSGENGLFDSGYEGGLGMCLVVKNPTYIQKNTPIAQVVFFKSYAKGSEYEGFYRGKEGPREWRSGN